MDLARYVVDAVVIEGRSARQVAQAHGISKSWVCELVARYRAGGYEALAPRSRRPVNVPSRISDELEDEIVLLRKQLEGDGLDAGAQTIHYHLSKRLEVVPSVSTIWRASSAGALSLPSPTNDPAAHTSGLRPACPTSAGSPT